MQFRGCHYIKCQKRYDKLGTVWHYSSICFKAFWKPSFRLVRVWPGDDRVLSAWIKVVSAALLSGTSVSPLMIFHNIQSFKVYKARIVCLSVHRTTHFRIIYRSSLLNGESNTTLDHTQVKNTPLFQISPHFQNTTGNRRKRVNRYTR